MKISSLNILTSYRWQAEAKREVSKTYRDSIIEIMMEQHQDIQKVHSSQGHIQVAIDMEAN